MVLFSPMSYADEITITRILKDCRTIAVVGLSSNQARTSYRVAAYMQSQSHRVIPVNPNETNVLGEPAYPSLAAVPDTIDLVNIFRKSEVVFSIIEEAMLVAPRLSGCKKGSSTNRQPLVRENPACSS